MRSTRRAAARRSVCRVLYLISRPGVRTAVFEGCLGFGLSRFDDESTLPPQTGNARVGWLRSTSGVEKDMVVDI